MREWSRLIALVGLALFASSGCGDDLCGRPICASDINPPAPGSPWTVEHSFVLPGGEFTEAQVQMAAGSRLVVGFESVSTISWDVHRHDGQMVQTFETGVGSDAEFAFDAPEADFYFPLWTNTGDSPVSMTVRVRLTDGDEIIAWF